MRIYLSYAQFQAIRKSVIISDLVLIVLTAIAFYYSFFVDIVHFFIFAVACFLVKLVANLFVKKEYRFPSYIHLIAPFPVFTGLLIFIFVYCFFSFIVFIYFLSANFIFSLILFLIIGIIIALLFLIKYIFMKLFSYKIYYYKFSPSYRLYNYYMFMGSIFGKNVNMICLVLKIACFYSIAFSIVFAIIAKGIHPVEEFIFWGLFAPLLSFAFFNFVEIIVFLFAKLRKSGCFLEYETNEYKTKEDFKFLIPVIFACFLDFLIAITPYLAKPFVKNYLGSQYKPTMEKLIEQKRNYK
ncbi:MAG: hypothetical protein IJ143_03300 [Neisseriaceae bacterium]|nr:hypothetical protein [Neisseriaceae bacterium]